MLASITSTLTDRGLGLPQGTAEPISLTGCSSSGDVDTPTLCLTPTQVTTKFGQGPLVELALFIMNLVGGALILTRTTTATAGAAGSVTRAGSGGSPMTAAASGTPRDAYRIRLLVTRPGATLEAATAAVKVSVDGGQTYGPEQPVPTSGAVVIGDTGVTITFTDTGDTLQLYAGNVYSCDCTAPVWDGTGLASALAALAIVGPTLSHDGVVVVGDVDATSAAVVKASMTALIAASKPRWFLCNARDQDVAGSESVATWVGVLVGGSPGFAAFTANLMAIGAGFCDIDSVGVGGIWRRPVSWPLAARLAATPPQRHPGRVRDGALAGIRPGGLYHDLSAAALQVLDTRRFIGAQSLQGLDGYVATDRTTAADGSDYINVMRVRVIVYAARIAMQRMVQEVNEERLVNSDGTIDAAEADAIDAAVTSYLTHELADAASGRRYAASVSVAVDRTTNLVTTGRLAFTLRLTPIGYSTAITQDLGYALASR